MGPDTLGEAGAVEGSGIGQVRAFFGLPLPEEHRAQLDAYLAACATAAPGFRWTPAANLHLTIRFLGQVDQGLAEGIAGHLETANLRGFQLRLGESGIFRRGRLARVVWIGLAEGEEPARLLAAAVEGECVRAGLEPEARRFSPHLTLARARTRDGAPPPHLPPPPDLPAWRADGLVLYRSHLGRAGSVYEPLRTLRLG